MRAEVCPARVVQPCIQRVKMRMARLCLLITYKRAMGALLVAFAIPAGIADAQMPSAEPSPAHVSVVIAKRSTVTQRIPVVGTLAPRDEVQVHPSVFGQKITDILVEAGQYVEKGQALALIDNADALLALEKNEMNMRRARAAVAVEKSRVDVALVSEREAARKHERSKALQSKGIVSAQSHEDNQNAFERAVAQSALARQSLSLAQADEQIIMRERQEIELTIARSTVRAPEAGLVLERNAHIGTITSNAADPLFLIAQNGKIEFVAKVMETNFVQLHAGMYAEFMLSGSQNPVSGRVRMNAAQLDAKTRSGTVHIELNAADGLVAGIFARGAIEISTRTAIFLPGTAVRNAYDSHKVYVVRNGVVEIRSVQTGMREDNLVEIVTGLDEGEMVVLKAGGFLKEGERIEPIIRPVGNPLSNTLQKVSLNEREGTDLR